MATITMRKTKRGTTISMKAGKGEDLRNVVAALAGDTPEARKNLGLEPEGERPSKEKRKK
jgi:hypothetical protein